MRGRHWVLASVVVGALLALNLWKYGDLMRSSPVRGSPELPMGPVALLFMVTNELSNERIWDYWLEDARRWAKDRYPQAFERYGLSAVLTMYVHTDTEGVPLLPEGMKGSTVESIKCEWAATVPCMIRVLEAGFEGRRGEPQASFFVYVSGTTIPIKRFSVIYESLVENPRSRFAFSNINMPTPKHHQWVVLSRTHAAVLMKNHAVEWKKRAGKWMTHAYPDGIQSHAADDEHSTFRVLAEALGRDKALQGINGGEPLPSLEDVAPRPHELDRWRTTWVCWNASACYYMGTKRLKDGKIGVPIHFSEVDEAKFKATVWDTGNWFARKFDSTTMSRPLMSKRPKKLSEFVVSLFEGRPTAP